MSSAGWSAEGAPAPEVASLVPSGHARRVRAPPRGRGRAVHSALMPSHVVVVLLDSLNRHMLGCYGGDRVRHAEPRPVRRARAMRFTSHYTGSLPCMPARHDILCGALDFLWRPWGSIELWEEPITAPPAARRA